MGGLVLHRQSLNTTDTVSSSSSVPKIAVQETLFAVSVGLDTLQAGWSLDLACVAHLQVHDLRKLAAIAEHYADEIHDAQDVLKFPTRP